MELLRRWFIILKDPSEICEEMIAVYHQIGTLLKNVDPGAADL
jgi:hypothetical protein